MVDVFFYINAIIIPKKKTTLVYTKMAFLISYKTY